MQRKIHTIHFMVIVSRKMLKGERDINVYLSIYSHTHTYEIVENYTYNSVVKKTL